MPHRLLSLTCALAIVTGVTACGSSTTTPRPTFKTNGGTTGAAPTNPAAILNLQNAQAAPQTKPGDVTVQLAPALYSDPGNPCAGVTENMTIVDAPIGCGTAYRTVSTIVAGTKLVGTFKLPSVASVQPSIARADAITIGNGFEVAADVQLWAVTLNAPEVLPSIDGVSKDADQVYKVLTSKPEKYAVVPACAYPTHLRIAAADTKVQQYMTSLGWPMPTGTAVVASYDACAGVVVNFTDGTSTTILGHTKPVSVVITGAVSNVAPFGPMFVQNGWAPCGAADLASVCS